MLTGNNIRFFEIKRKKFCFFFNSLWGLNTKITQERIDKRKNEEMDGWMTVQ